MDDDPFSTLAMTGATTLVAAMATAAWEGARRLAARLFGHHDPAPETDVARELEVDNHRVESAQDARSVREFLIPLWQQRLGELLRDHPEVEGDLRELVKAVQATLPAGAMEFQQINIVRGGGQGFSAQYGNVIVHQYPPEQ